MQLPGDATLTQHYNLAKIYKIYECDNLKKGYEKASAAAKLEKTYTSAQDYLSAQ